MIISKIYYTDLKILWNEQRKYVTHCKSTCNPEIKVFNAISNILNRFYYIYFFIGILISIDRLFEYA
jgi:hypothetical protein